MTTAARIQRSTTERDRLIEQYLPLVRYVVARLPVASSGSLDRDDFYSVGVMGLMQAAASFDPARGASFKTFAYTAIRGAILDEVRKHDPVPRSRRDRLRKLDRANAELQVRLGRQPTPAELANLLQCTEQDLDEDLQALHTSRMLSLDERFGGEEDGGSLVSQVRDPDAIDPVGQADARENLDRLTKAIAELPEVDRHVVVLYFHEQLFLKEIGELLSVTESRVSQILSRAIERLRLKLKEPD